MSGIIFFSLDIELKLKSQDITDLTTQDITIAFVGLLICQKNSKHGTNFSELKNVTRQNVAVRMQDIG